MRVEAPLLSSTPKRRTPTSTPGTSQTGRSSAR
ncbi:hypothetical protein CRUP_017834 [Coryphaenoides rupestris]|nr:hypothetical protein CRUP_017834 [Coryphaenoides rupestris]